MSCIDRLLVQGIRSFGASDSDKAVIQFGSPLTLITGQNGAGKTTIIECLKYITTGDQPPNTKGGAFIHDPKLVGETQVKAVVKLKFKDITGSEMVCHRIIQSLQKVSKTEVKTLDSSLEIIVGQEKRKVTGRCADIDKEMVERLGVSKAILSNVIFCHQEEATWPLSEGKALKQKFDEIFASTRYSKALDSIRKVRTEQNTECKVYSAELEYLKKHKLKAEVLEADLKEIQRKVENAKNDLSRLTDEIKPMEERKQVMDDLYQEAEDLKTRIAELQTIKKEYERNENELLRKITTQFSGSKQELERAFEDHHNLLERNIRELSQVERRQGRAQVEVEEVEKRLSQLYQERGRRETEHKHYETRMKERDGQVVSLAQQLGLSGWGGGTFTPDTIRRFLSDVGKRIQEMEERAEQERHVQQEEEDGLQKQINDLRTNLAQLEQSLKMRRSAVEEGEAKVSSIERELSSLAGRGSALEGLEQDLLAAEQELEETQTQTNIPSLEDELSALRGSKRKMEERVSELQQELAAISRQSSSRGTLEAFRKDKRSKEDQYQNEMSAMEDSLLSVLGHIPAPDDRGLAEKLSEMERKTLRESRGYEEQLQRKRYEFSRLQTQLEQTKHQLKNRTAKMDALQQEVCEVCQGEEAYEGAMKRLQQELEESMNDLHTVKGSQQYFKKALEKTNSSRKCPLCTRGFDDETSFQKAVKSITDRLNQSVPRLLPQLEEKQKQLQMRQKKLQQLQPKIEELSEVRDKEIPHLKMVQQQKEAELTTLQDDISRVEQKSSELHSILERVRGLQPHVVQATQLKRDLEDLDSRISSEESKLGGRGSSRSQPIVQRELQEAQMKSKEVELKMDHTHNEIATNGRQIRELERKVYQLRDEKLRLQERLQKQHSLILKKEELAREIQSNQREIKVLSHRQGPVQEKLRALEKQKKELVSSRMITDNKRKSELLNIRSTEESTRTASMEILRYLNEGGESALQQCSALISQLQKEAQGKEEDKRRLEEQKKHLQDQVANAKVRERELEDNLQLLEFRAEISTRGEDVMRLRQKMREMGLDRYDEEYQSLQEKLDNLRRELARKTGMSGGLQDRVHHMQSELQEDIYRNATEKHTGMLVKLKTTEMAIKDLDKYFKVLDRAIMRYHKMKMEEINKILRELWMRVYRGGDIDTIEIRSDDTSDTDSGGVLKTRRVYHYRVVMLKGETALDMRGRCSAGQKVLASILIRLALAESFCVDCGILALDEPTTNLDRDNVEGLAQALADIVKDRQTQKNFQLIVITHDMEFVGMLGQGGYTEFYYKVSKNVGECSRISRHRL